MGCPSAPDRRMCSDGARSRAAILDAAGVEAESDLAFAALGLAPGAAGDARRRPPEVHEELAAAVLAVSRW